jgi:hypothetical protein
MLKVPIEVIGGAAAAMMLTAYFLLTSGKGAVALFMR